MNTPNLHFYGERYCYDFFLQNKNHHSFSHFQKYFINCNGVSKQPYLGYTNDEIDKKMKICYNFFSS